ncbi:flippase [Moraxella osloensis]|nr:flippase [Moraxella osloensis]QQU07467.1 flippase [Moraxella osloensis]
MSKKIFKNASYLGIVQLVNYVFPLITVPYVSRIIGPEGYGIINYATTFVGYFSLLIAYGFDLTGTRRIVRYLEQPSQINQIVSEILTARILLFIISIFLFTLAIIYFKPIQDDIVVAVILFFGCIATVISPQFIFQGFEELTIFAKLNFFRGILNVILVFLLIKQADDYIMLAVLSSIFLISINGLLCWLCIRKFGINYRLVKLKQAIKLLNEEKMVFFSTVVISLYTTTNVIILGWFASKAEVGYYTVSQMLLGMTVSVISAPISLAIYPHIGKSFAISREHGIETVKQILPIIFYITFGVSLMLLLFAPIVINLLYGEKFDNAIAVLQILSFQPLIIGMSNVFGIQVMLNMGLDKLFFRSTFVASFLGVILSIYMSKYFSYIGTAWNSIIVECFVTFLMYTVLKKNNIHILELKYFKPKEIKSFFAK